MKTDNIFDKLENETTINENTIIENTGVSTERVLDMVKKEIGSTGVKKRKSALKLTALIAAALTASVITASAVGGFNSAFGTLFAGGSLDGLYSGGDIQIESENVNVEFLGIAGDDYIVASAMKLQKEDGSPFVDSIENSWIGPTSTDNTADYLYGSFRDTVKYTTPLWFKYVYPYNVDDNGERNDYVSTFDFFFEDESTISAYIFSSSFYHKAFRGETMTASAERFSVYTIEEVVYDYSEHINENLDEYGWWINDHFYKALAEEFQTFGTDEKDGLRVMVDPETMDIVLAHETPLDISFSISVKMNYKNSTTKLVLKDVDKCFRKWNTGASGKISVTPFNVLFSVKLDKEMVHSYDEAARLAHPMKLFSVDDDISMEPETLTFTLEDGTTIIAYDVGTIADVGIGLDATEFTVQYQFIMDDRRDGRRIKPVAIDPNKIVKIETDSAVIYEK